MTAKRTTDVIMPADGASNNYIAIDYIDPAQIIVSAPNGWQHTKQCDLKVIPIVLETVKDRRCYEIGQRIMTWLEKQERM